MEGSGPTTYWIDVAERGARGATETGSETPFTSGNITSLRVVGTNIVAAYDFGEPESDPSEAMPLADFLDLLRQWRDEVMAAGGTPEDALWSPRPPRPMPPAS